MNCIPQIKRLDKCREIIGIGIHVIATPGLARSAVTSTVVSDTPVPFRGEKKHLVFKGIGRQRPSVTENDRLPCAPVFVINLCSVVRSNSPVRVLIVLIHNSSLLHQCRVIVSWLSNNCLVQNCVTPQRSLACYAPVHQSLSCRFHRPHLRGKS